MNSDKNAYILYHLIIGYAIQYALGVAMKVQANVG